MSDTIYKHHIVPEKWRFNLIQNPPHIFQDLDEQEIWQICVFELFQNGKGNKTSTSWEKGNVPWNKGLKNVQPKWSEERKEIQSERLKERHKKLGHVEGGKQYTKKGLSSEERVRRSIHSKSLNKTMITCEHCGKVNNTGNHNRWHGDNCEHKQVNNVSSDTG